MVGLSAGRGMRFTRPARGRAARWSRLLRRPCVPGGDAGARG